MKGVKQPDPARATQPVTVPPKRDVRLQLHNPECCAEANDSATPPPTVPRTASVAEAASYFSSIGIEDLIDRDLQARRQVIGLGSQRDDS
jgi:hypothetical protein